MTQRLRSAVWLPLVLLALSCGGRGGRPPAAEVLEFDLTTPPGAAPDSSAFASTPPLHLALEQLAEAARSESCKGIYVRVGAFGGAWGRIADIGEGLDAVRESGKPVHCHFDSTDNAGYALMARHCDRISMTPAGIVDLVGVALQVVYIRSLLDHIGVEANILHMGRFKGAGDMFTERSMPETARESLSALLDDMDASLVGALEQRNLQARPVIDGGPYTSVDALEARIIDDIVFDDQARDTLRQSVGNAPSRRVFPPERDEEFSLGDLLLAKDDDDDNAQGRRIALVHVAGSIVDGNESRSGQAASGPFVRAMREFADDDDIAAIVLRIDSPGGSVVASDVMWHAVHEAAQKKPVIASLGDVAASGGYYIASAANLVLAHEASIVGSIGVVGGKMSLAALADNMGVHAETLRRGENATLFSPLTPFSESEAEAFQGVLRSAYYRFVRRVAEGRGSSQEQVLAAAEGRVMSGREGIERGLVDRVGGLSAALLEAQDRAREPQGAPDLPVEVWPRRGGPLAALGNMLRVEQSTALTGALPWAPLVREWLWLPELIQRESVVAALPFAIRIE